MRDIEYLRSLRRQGRFLQETDPPINSAPHLDLILTSPKAFQVYVKENKCNFIANGAFTMLRKLAVSEAPYADIVELHKLVEIHSMITPDHIVKWVTRFPRWFDLNALSDAKLISLPQLLDKAICDRNEELIKHIGYADRGYLNREDGKGECDALVQSLLHLDHARTLAAEFDALASAGYIPNKRQVREDIFLRCIQAKRFDLADSWACCVCNDRFSPSTLAQLKQCDLTDAGYSGWTALMRVGVKPLRKHLRALWALNDFGTLGELFNRGVNVPAAVYPVREPTDEQIRFMKKWFIAPTDLFAPPVQKRVCERLDELFPPPPKKRRTLLDLLRQ